MNYDSISSEPNKGKDMTLIYFLKFDCSAGFAFHDLKRETNDQGVRLSLKYICPEV